MLDHPKHFMPLGSIFSWISLEWFNFTVFSLDQALKDTLATQFLFFYLSLFAITKFI